MKFPKAIFFVLVCSTLTVYGQYDNFVFQHLTSANGLTSNYIYSVFQDSKGFYWIGTTSGLQLFDGYTVSKPLKTGNDLLNSPKVSETRDGIIWISTATSLYRYNRVTKIFTPLTTIDNDRAVNLTVIEDSLGTVWLINKFKLYKYDAGSGKLISWIELPYCDPALTSGAVTFDKSSGKIWIQNGYILYGLSPQQRKITSHQSMPYLLAGIWKDIDDKLWLSFWTQQLCRYDISSGKKEWFTMSYKETASVKTKFAIATCFARDQYGKLWIGSAGAGLWTYDESERRIKQVRTDKVQPWNYHYTEMTYSILLDNEKNIWVGSDKGLNIFSPYRQQFYSHMSYLLDSIISSEG